ncbi:hypothetical protein ACFSO9_16135 [Mesonia maritima]|uniref:hypothetical protein n=1 Tax=Mesonia maritima TaxID=1793873 RepID=UPI00364358D8
MNSSEIIPSLEQSLITTDRDCIQLGSEEVATILVNLKSEEGEIIEEGGADVLIYAEGIEISETEDNKDGSYRAFISGAREINEARVGFRLDGKPSTKLITIRVQERCPEPFIDFERTQLIAEPPEILNDGKDYSTLLLQLYDREGRLLDDKTPVSLMANSGILSSTVFDAEQRLFTAFFRSRRVGEVGVYVSVRNVRYPVTIGEVRVVDPEPPEEEFSIIPYESHTMLQSSSLYLQAAGSPGIDSTKGIHLRWMLRGALGELHLPKGNLAEPNQTFNRSEDYVKIYRAKYSKVSFTLNLNRERPAVIDHANRLWIYRKEETREIYLYFRNAAKYDSLISNMSADINHSNFIALYHPELLEFECKDDLFLKLV